MIGRAPLVVRALAAAAAGALAAALALIVAYARLPGYHAPLDTTPPIARGLHPTEWEPGGLTSFAWSRDRVLFTFDGLDRSQPWTFVMRAKAGRGPGLPMPSATVDVDGTARGTTAVGNAWQEVRAEVPADPAPRTRPTRVTIDVAPTFVPGPGDTRTLGLIVDDVRLIPASGWPLAPRRAIVAAATAGAIVGAALVAIGVPAWGALALLVAFAIAQAVALSTGSAPYTRPYLDLVAPLAAGVTLAAGALAGASALLLRRPWSAAAATLVGFSLVALLLELDGLLHPGKPLIDALFHAHRLQWVLAGRYFFTQPMPSGVEFPYAIGLYVFASPWAALLRDHVLLLRLVVLGMHALAALSLYPLVVRRWDSRPAAVVAAAAYHLVPLPYIVIGNANMTYAFGQEVATIALASAMTWPLAWRRPLASAGLTALLALGLLSHVGLIALLGALVGGCALLVALRGAGEDRQAGWITLAALAVAAVLAVGLYYVHFGDAFRSAGRVSQAGPAAPAAAAERPEEETPTTAAQTPATGTSRAARLGRAVLLEVDAYGIPLLALAAVGLWRLRPFALRDRLTLMVSASVVVGVAIVAAAVVAPVEPRFERYTDEFISRLYYALIPAAVLLASRGATWLWSLGRAGQAAAAVALACVLGVGVRAWLGWMA